MSINKMLIDATHPEETRVVVLRENRVEEFDYESAARKLLRGSIYLAKITRVEPSLQACFVDYGGNRHGFLAFAEVHPDYYQIPHADKVALLEQESRDLASIDDDLDADVEDAEEATAAAAEADDNGREAPPTASDDDSEETESGAPDPSAAAAPVEPATQSSPEPDFDFEAHAIDVTELLPDPGADAEREAETGHDDAAAADADETAPRNASLDVTQPAADKVTSEVVTTAESEAPSAGPASDAQTVAEPSEEPSAAEAVGATIDSKDSDVATPSDRTDDDEEDGDEEDAVESLNDDIDDDDAIEAIAGEDEADEDEEEETDQAPVRRKRTQRPRRRARHYKIQEVIKRRQIVLIQVVKEERGNKGAALTTYLSLAGRYTVLMPNTARGGGISRKITNVQDRKRLKAIAQELEVPEGMGLIIRTAGAARTKQEIKRDFEYLLRLWESVRSLTLESTAPSLVYEEGNLIKRSIRDLYTKEIDEVAVAGEQAHKEAKAFMRMLMPSHAKNVVKHEDTQSLFAKYRIEQQLNAMFSPNVQLKSGGYLVINQTEALVAIDVNSGKSTREFSIEETALNTNLEAAEELSRQLKLRDLAGLIVIDFIDMEEKRNNRAVERRLKDSLRADRARIQVGRISHFGLLEMSRQRLRTGVLEGSTTPCDHCQGSGIIRSIESVSLAVLRGLEDTLVAGKMASCVANCSAEVALYLLNQKRAFIQELEDRYGVVIHVRSSQKQQGANFLIEPMNDAVTARPRAVSRDAINIDTAFNPERVADNDDERDDSASEAKPRRRRRRRGRRDEAREAEGAVEEVELADGDAQASTAGETDANGADAEAGEERPRRSRRRGRRGGRRHRDQRAATDDVATPGAAQPDLDLDADDAGSQPADGTDQPQAVADMAPPDEAPMEFPEAPTDAPETEPGPATEAAAAETAAPATTAEAETESAEAEPVDADPVAPPADETPAFAVAATTPEPVEETAPVEAVAEVADTPTGDAEPTEDHTTDRSPRSQPVAGEPVIQRVVVSPNGAQNGSTGQATVESEEMPADAPPKPSRRGWWQRQFGG